MQLVRLSEKIVCALLFFAGEVSVFSEDRLCSRSKPFVLTHANVIDATGAPARPDSTVVIVGDRIAEVGPAKEIKIPPDAEVVDASNKFLIPGLWDMHVHLFDPEYLKLFVANGVTGVRIMWGSPSHFEWRRKIDDGILTGPRLVIGSPIVDGPKPVFKSSLEVGNDRGAREAVTKLKHDGYDFIKVYSVLPRQAYFALADEARKQGITFAGHVPYSVTASEASDAGQKSFEHLIGVLAGCSAHEDEWRSGFEQAFLTRPEGQVPRRELTRPLTRLLLEDLDQEKTRRLFDRFKRNHTWQCPTLTVLRSIAFADNAAFRNDARLKYIPEHIRKMWDPSADFRFKDKTAEDFELAKLTYKKQVELVKLMHGAHVDLLAGTDTPNPYCFPGFSLHDELSLLVQAGLSPMEALQTATLNPARFFGMEKELGTIEKSKFADLLLLDANPLENIGNTQRINTVVFRGKLLRKSAREEILREIESTAGKSKPPETPAGCMD